MNQAQMFPCEFYEISKNTYFVDHLRTAASKEFRKMFEVSTIHLKCFKIMKYNKIRKH